jgi:putative hydrolase of the HAD superfamily
MKYQAVIFDLFGTLVPSESSREYEQTLIEMADAISAPPGDFARLWHDSWYGRMTGRFPTTEANIEHICQKLDVHAGRDMVSASVSIRRAFVQRLLNPWPDAVDTLAQLMQKGYKIGLISDCSPEVPLLWPETPFESLIDVPVFSCDVGLKKPDLRMYQSACDRLGVSPRDCLYIGDGGSRELTGAAAAGMHPVMISVPEQPGDAYRHEAEEWHGLSISALREVLTLVD